MRKYRKLKDEAQGEEAWKQKFGKKNTLKRGGGGVVAKKMIDEGLENHLVVVAFE